MKPQSKLIAFCYLYIAGLAVAMLLPLDSSWLAWLRAGAGLAAALATGILLYGVVAGGGATEATLRSRLNRGLWPLLCLAGLLLGYTRYTSSNTVPDMQVGEIRIRGDERTFHQRAPLPDASRLRLQKASPLSGDVRIRLRGELDARRPIVNARGVAQMDEAGQWKFQITRAPLVSEIITIPAADPVGADYVIEQPFSRITGIEWLDGPADGLIAVHRISNHIGSFVRPGRAQSPVTVLGTITSDPRVYDFKTVLMITPDYIQYPAGGPFYRVEGGDIQVTLQSNLTNYTEFDRTDAYGADVQLRGELTVARAEANPGGFDARQFMQNYDIFGLMSLYQPRGMAPPIERVAPEGGAVRTGNPLVSFSLYLRDRILHVFKETMPYPQSAFLGGVTLGMRYGLQGTQFPGEREVAEWWSYVGLGRSEALIADDFRASGVNHVLAVSGLHVTIITALFVAIFGLLRFPKQVFVPFIIFTLVVFAIITGARPSTLRAVIMNSLFLLTWGYLDKSLLSSVMLGVPVAAFIILLHNPLVVVDPSFTLSFGAILSLALLTMPSHELLSRLRGNRFLAVILFTLATTLVGIFHWALVVTPTFIVPWLLLGVLMFWVAGALETRGLALPRSFAFTAMPESISTFLAAQIAIQIGMMIPLSAYYFSRWPFGGAFANLIAIPLIGIVVQLGAIAGLLGLIPGVGLFIALLLNAANWVFTTFFLWLAHVFALAFPYPVVRRPRVIEVAVYYVFIAALIWHKPLWKGIVGFCESRGWKTRSAPALLAGGLAWCAILPLWLAPPQNDRPPGLKVTVLSVGYGSSILVESPGGKNILIDAGFVEHERGRRNEADRTILPFLAHSGIRSLDALILTSPLPERSAGAAYLLNQLRVTYLVVPPMLEGLSGNWTRSDLVDRWGGEHNRIDAMYHELVGHPQWPRRPALAKALAARDVSPVNRWANWSVAVTPVRTGMSLFEETVDGKSFRIEVLGPDENDVAAYPGEDRGLVLRLVYGDFAMLLPGALYYEGQRRLAQTRSPDQLRADVLVVPHHGAAIPGSRPAREDVLRQLDAATAPLLDKVKPDVAVFEFGSPRPVLGDEGRPAAGVYDITRQYYADTLGEDALLGTDRDLAILLYSDGSTYTMETQARRNRASGGEEDAVSDLSVGF
jgi:ComEC/Rec2-related protein